MVHEGSYYKMAWRQNVALVQVTSVTSEAVCFLVNGAEEAASPEDFAAATICEMQFIEVPESPEVMSAEKLCAQVMAEARLYADHLLVDSPVDMDRLTLQLIDHFVVEGWVIGVHDLKYTREFRRRLHRSHPAPHASHVTNHLLARLQTIANVRVGAEWVNGVDEVNGELVVYLHPEAPDVSFPVEFNAVPVRVTRGSYPLTTDAELRRYARRSTNPPVSRS